MKMIVANIVVFFFCLVPLGLAQTVSLDDLLTMVQANHPFFEKESLTSKIAQESQNRYLGDKDWLFESSSALSYENKTGLNNTTYNELGELQIDGSLQKKFWKTGGRLSASYSSVYIDQDYRTLFTNNPSQFFRQQLAITYSHPLLKNHNGILDRLEYELAAYAVNFSEIQATENKENFLLNIGISFLDWIFLEEQLKINNERLQLAEEELASSKEKYEAHLIDKVDVLRQEDTQRIAMQKVVLAQSLWAAKRTELAVLALSPEINESEPIFDIYNLFEREAVDQTVSELNNNSRILKALDLLQGQLALKKFGFANREKPQLDLNFGSAFIEDDVSYGKSFSLSNPSLSVGLKFTYPLGSQLGKADLRKTELEILQLKADRQSIYLDLESSVKSLMIQIEKMEYVLELNQSQIESAKERTLEEMKVYEQGRGDMTFVIQSQDNEANARLTYLQNAIAYHKLTLQYRALLDRFLFTE